MGGYKPGPCEMAYMRVRQAWREADLIGKRAFEDQVTAAYVAMLSERRANRD